MGASNGNGVVQTASVPASPTAIKTFEADKPDGKSPTILATVPLGPPDEELELERRKTQEEDKKDESEDREVDIYADAVLACSIENREACEMCSG
jgi:ribonucleoside-diphosphate reductase subunit M1